MYRPRGQDQVRLTRSSAKCLESTFPVKESEGRGRGSQWQWARPVCRDEGVGSVGGAFRLAPLPDPFLNEANLAAATNALSEFQMPDIKASRGSFVERT